MRSVVLRRQKDLPAEGNTTIRKETLTTGITRIFASVSLSRPISARDAQPRL